MNLGKPFWIKLCVESLLIVFSVLLALALNEYRTSNKEHKATQQALFSIRQELKSNQEILKTWHQNHQQVLKNIQAYRRKSTNADSLVKNHMFQFQHFLHGPLVSNLVRSTAWETAQNTGLLQNFDLSLANTLSNVYDIQRIGVVTSVDKLLTLLFDRQTHQQESIAQTLVILEITLDELVAQEAYLLENYRKALIEVDAALNE